MSYLTSLPPTVLYEVFAYLNEQTFRHLALTSSVLAEVAEQAPRFFKVTVYASSVVDGLVDARLRNIDLRQPDWGATDFYAQWLAEYYKQKSQPWTKYVRSFMIKRCLEWYPPNVKSMAIVEWVETNGGIPADNLPKTLLSLSIQGYNQSLQPRVLPMGLVELSFDRGFNQALEIGVLPNTLRKLHLGCDYNLPLRPHVLPDGLQDLEPGAGFNQPLEIGVLPNTLRRLKFGLQYNQPLRPHVLPDNLQDLSLGIQYNHPLEPGVLPSNLLALKFSVYFNHPIEPGILPSGLQALCLCWGFNQQLQPGALPQSLLALEWGIGKDINIYPGVLPPNLVALNLYSRHTVTIRTEALPQSLRTLQIDYEVMNSLQPDLLPDHLDVVQINAWTIPPAFVAKTKRIIHATDKSHIISKRLSTEFPELVEILTRWLFFY